MGRGVEGLRFDVDDVLVVRSSNLTSLPRLSDDERLNIFVGYFANESKLYYIFVS